jgi:ferredoxin/coenzyme F420-reducing hydrogenase delta subunit
LPAVVPRLPRLARGWEAAERLLDRLVGADANPLSHLGALGWACYFVVLISGIYLYCFFDTGITQAYESIEAILRAHGPLGRLMRGLHRYASDALVLILFLHMAREFVYGRLRGPRWFSWWTGIAVLGLVYASGVTGYWLIWDRLAQYVAIVTAEWLDTVGLFAEPIARNFLDPAHVSGRLFTLVVYLHIAVPLFLLLFLWIHIQRQTEARILPPRALALGTLLALSVLSLVWPALSHQPAALETFPREIALDWYYLWYLPLLDRVPGATLWLALAGALFLGLGLPWWPFWRFPGRRLGPAAVVHPESCNGCGRCHADCPYTAITMEPRSDGSPFTHLATVREALCVRCGICLGSCPTATPFRRRGALPAGIALPDLPAALLKQRIDAAAAPLTGPTRVLVFGCRAGPGLARLAGPDTGTVALPCIGALPPSFIDYALSRDLVDGVLLTGCRPDACYERLGVSITQERLAGQRDPSLRQRIHRQRIREAFFGASGGGELGRALAGLRAEIAALGPISRPSGGAGGRTVDRQGQPVDRAPMDRAAEGSTPPGAGIAEEEAAAGAPDLSLGAGRPP